MTVTAIHTANETSAPVDPKPTTVLVGYGHAGRDLHHNAVTRLFGPEHEVRIVDPGGLPSVGAARHLCLDDALGHGGIDPAGAVFHVTTAPARHAEDVARLLQLGARHIILEKPVAPTPGEAREIERMAAGHRVRVMNVWANSTTTQALQQRIGDGTRIRSLHIEQSKPRFSRSRASISHSSVFEVELPHQVLLATHLAGPVRSVLGCRTWPMVLPDRVLPLMGGAEIRLLHEGGVVTTLVSDLTSPVRRRQVQVSLDGSQVVASFPVGSDDFFGQVSSGPGQPSVAVEDEPVTRFIDAAYAEFRGQGAGPLGASLAEHCAAAQVLQTAQRIAVTTGAAFPGELASCA